MAHPTGVLYTDELIELMEMRLFMEPVPQYNLHQFVMENFDFTKRPGDTVRIMGPNFLARPSAPLTDRKLASLATKVSAQAVQNLDLSNKQEITLDEYLLTSPLQVQEYDQKHTIHDIAAITGAVLAEDYHAWRDVFLRYRLEQNTFKGYAGGTSIGTLGATDYFSSDFFAKSVAALEDMHIPHFPDGNYICVIDPQTKSTLLQEQKFIDAQTRGRFSDQAPVFTGELGVYNGVRFVVNNNMTTLTGGTSPTHTAHRAFLFGTNLFGMLPLGSAEGQINAERPEYLKGWGAGPLVQLVGMPVEVRPSEITDYGRFSTVIWIEHSQYVLFDPNPDENGTYAGKTVGTDSRYCRQLFGAVKA